jgi:ankyrin repeat protein
MLDLLLSNGSSVDVRSDEGSTPLMLAVQGRRLDHARFLLERGADARAADARDFTSLHRAAEMGQLDMAQLLLANGASPTAEAGVHTPLSLARGRKEAAMEALLAKAGATR